MDNSKEIKELCQHIAQVSGEFRMQRLTLDELVPIIFRDLVVAVRVLDARIQELSGTDGGGDARKAEEHSQQACAADAGEAGRAEGPSQLAWFEDGEEYVQTEGGTDTETHDGARWRTGILRFIFMTLDKNAVDTMFPAWDSADIAFTNRLTGESLRVTREWLDGLADYCRKHPEARPADAE